MSLFAQTRLSSQNSHAIALAIALVAGLWLIAVLLIWATRYGSFFIDDTFIHFTYASRFLSGDGFVFNPGERPIQGTSSPAWNLFMMPAVLFSRDNPLPFIKVASTLLAIATGVLIVFAVQSPLAAQNLRSLRPVLALSGIALLMMLLTFSEMWRWFFSGMELPVFLALYALVAVLTERVVRKQTSQGKLIAAALALSLIALYLARPEGMVAILVVGSYLLVHSRFWRGVNDDNRTALLVLAFAILLGLAWLVYTYFTFGSIIPATVSAKGTALGVASESPLGRINDYRSTVTDAYGLMVNTALVLGAALIAISPARALIWPRSPLFVVNAGFIVLTPVVYAFANGFLLDRVVPIFALPIAFIALSALREVVAHLYERGVPYRTPALAVLSVAVIVLGVVGTRNAMTYEDNHEALTTRYSGLKEVAQRIDTGFDQSNSENRWILLETLGVLSYYSDTSIIDIAGLVSHEFTSVSHLLDGNTDRGGSMLQEQRAIIREQVLEKRPSYIVLNPTQRETFIDGLFNENELELTEMYRTPPDGTGWAPFVLWSVEYF